MNGPYMFHPRGLFPVPISAEDIANDGDPKCMHIACVISQFVAKVTLDSRIIDTSFNKVFLKLALGENVPLTVGSAQLSLLKLFQRLGPAQMVNQAGSGGAAQAQPGYLGCCSTRYQCTPSSPLSLRTQCI
jgi:E3 ubiquitin-protein ligase TRIP12